MSKEYNLPQRELEVRLSVDLKTLIKPRDQPHLSGPV